jgi:hypothetical protein
MLSPACAGHPSYSATAITTRVVDADTKEPLEGVIVVTDWQLRVGGGVPGQLMLLETVTDYSGTFHFPAWGPRKALVGWLGNEDPMILLFKDGYQFKVALNPFRSVPSEMPTGIRTSIYDGKVIEMHRFNGTLQEWKAGLDHFQLSIEDATRGDCSWRSIPRLTAALGQESKKLSAAGITTGTYFDSLQGRELYEAQIGCGSVREFLRGLAR